MATIDPTPEQLHAHITGQPLRTGIHSDFNTCMYRAGCQQTEAAYVALQTEVQALRKDAERYCWLRNNCSGEPRTGDHAPSIVLFGLQGAAEDVWNETAVATNHLTDTIDAAMAAAPAVGAA